MHLLAFSHVFECYHVCPPQKTIMKVFFTREWMMFDNVTIMRRLVSTAASHLKRIAPTLRSPKTEDHEDSNAPVRGFPQSFQSFSNEMVPRPRHPLWSRRDCRRSVGVLASPNAETETKSDFQKSNFADTAFSVSVFPSHCRYLRHTSQKTTFTPHSFSNVSYWACVVCVVAFLGKA